MKNRENPKVDEKYIIKTTPIFISETYGSVNILYLFGFIYFIIIALWLFE